MDFAQGMGLALAQATAAAAAGEVPIGAAICVEDRLVAAAANACNAEANPLLHAEMRALHQAMPLLSQPAFRQATLFVTLEPCPMCMGAILHSHLGRLVFGAANLKWGCCGTVSDFRPLFPAQELEVWGGIREAECSALLESFFGRIRDRRAKE